MARPSLESLPDDLLIDILEHLNHAQDVSHLAQASRRTHTLVAHDGWRRFVRTRFTNWSVPGALPAHRGGWRAAADRLTHLDRCWDRRGLLLVNFAEKQQRRGGGRNAAARGTQQSVKFHPALDAGLLPGGEGELAAWGVGENLITRVSVEGKEDEWYRLDGKDNGYASGFGDVTAVSTLDMDGAPGVAVGRANGELHLLHAAGPNFGKIAQTISHKSSDTPSGSGSQTPTRKSPAQVAISWTEWHPSSNLLASSCNTTLSLYDLNNSEEANLQPILLYDMTLENDLNDVSLIRNAKYMDSKTIAVSLGGTREPLRWGRITPTEISFSPVSRDASERNDFLATKVDLERGSRTTVRAIEPVGKSGTLLLSAWDDGSYRLTDVRTPSPYDASYRDRWQPYEPGSSLLVYGTRHFVAGSNISPDIRLFDFRHPKPYHHTDALPCSASAPTPRPPFVKEAGEGNYSVCSHAAGQECAWHSLSKQPAWRPDVTIHTGRSWRNRVHALSKASDMSSRFYIGFEGAVTEANLTLSRDVSQSSLKRTHPEGWEAISAKGRVGLIENGVGLVDEEDWNRAPSENLEIWNQNQDVLRGAGNGPPLGNKYSRLDEAYTPPPPRREGEVRRNQRGWR